MKASEPESRRKVRPLNLRDFPDELYWKCKVQAAQEHMTLKQFIVRILEQSLSK
jgi:hypothetical protein